MAVKKITPVPNPLFQYANQAQNLRNRYNEDTANAQFSNWQNMQNFQSQRNDLNKNYLTGFPRFTGGWARRLGSGIQSGMFGEALNRNVSDYQNQLNRLGQSQARTQGLFVQQEAARKAALQNALLQLQNQYVGSPLIG